MVTELMVKISSGKEVIIKEIKYKDVLANTVDNKAEAGKILIKLATDITDEEFDNLTMKDGLLIQKAINDLNGLGEDFLQKAQNTNQN